MEKAFEMMEQSPSTLGYLISIFRSVHKQLHALWNDFSDNVCNLEPFDDQLLRRDEELLWRAEVAILGQIDEEHFDKDDLDSFFQHLVDAVRSVATMQMGHAAPSDTNSTSMLMYAMLIQQWLTSNQNALPEPGPTVHVIICVSRSTTGGVSKRRSLLHLVLLSTTTICC